MSSQPPMEKPKLVLSPDPPCDLIAAGLLHLGSAAALMDVSKTLKSTVDWSVGKARHTHLVCAASRPPFSP